MPEMVDDWLNKSILFYSIHPILFQRIKKKKKKKKNAHELLAIKMKLLRACFG